MRLTFTHSPSIPYVATVLLILATFSSGAITIPMARISLDQPRSPPPKYVQCADIASQSDHFEHRRAWSVDLEDLQFGNMAIIPAVSSPAPVAWRSSTLALSPTRKAVNQRHKATPVPHYDAARLQTPAQQQSSWF